MGCVQINGYGYGWIAKSGYDWIAEKMYFSKLLLQSQPSPKPNFLHSDMATQFILWVKENTKVLHARTILFSVFCFLVSFEALPVVDQPPLDFHSPMPL